MRKKSLITAIILTAALMIVSILYLSLSDRDPYKYFTGLGDKVSIANNDQQIAFSYFEEGSEAIYTADADGINSKKITEPGDSRHRKPIFSPDGSKLLYFEQESDNIQSLFIVNKDGENANKLSQAGYHVSEAIFSKDGKEIYFVAMPADDFKNWEERSNVGYNLYSVQEDGSKLEQLTDQKRLSMESLILTEDGSKILFKDYTDLYEYDIEKAEVSFSKLTKEMPSEPFYLSISPSGTSVAYTLVSKESEDSSLYEYELYKRNLENGETQQLTKLKKAVVSPVFYHQKEKILFLQHTNWPQDPEKFKLMTVDLQNLDLKEVALDIPEPTRGNPIMKAIDYVINTGTIGLLYTILLLLLTLYFSPKKTFMPSFLSLGLAAVGLIASFIVAALADPWAGIGIGTLSGAIGLCTFVSFIFAFILKFIKKKDDLHV